MVMTKNLFIYCKLVFKCKPLSYIRDLECIISRLKKVSTDLNFGCIPCVLVALLSQLVKM